MGWQPGPPVELGLGVLRPAMARLAGELADVAITWLTPAGYLRDVIVPALREGARAAGRPVPRLAANRARGPERARSRPGGDLVLAANSGHLSMPHYQDMLRRSGIEVDPDNLAVTAKGVVASNAFVSGDPGELRAALQEYRTAGWTRSC